MSKPQNPLNFYRSYSYYFILGVAGSTLNAQNAANSVTPDTSEGNYPTYTILCNGAKDTRFIVQSVGIQSMLNPNQTHNGETFFHTMHLSGDIMIQEPMGIKLYNVLRNAAARFHIAGPSLVWFIKPIFVGFLPDQSAEVIPSTKPYIFMSSEMTSSIDEGGATYSLKTYGSANGAAVLDSYESIADGFSLQFKQNITLSEGIKHFQNELNEYYKERVKAVIAAGQAQHIDTPAWANETREIRYFIILDPIYTSANYIVGSNLKLLWAEEGAFHIVQGPTASIETIIKKIMLSCSQVVNDRNISKKYGYDISRKFSVQSLVNSTEKTIHLFYHIKAYEMSFLPMGGKAKNIPNALEFDYIYTGKNVDIRNFDMKLLGALAWFNLPATTDTIDQGINKNTNKCVGGSGSSGIIEKDLPGAAKGAAKGIGNSIRDNDSRNKSNPASSAMYMSMLRRWSALESIGIKLEIKGNPCLLEQTIFTPNDILSGKPQLSLCPGNEFSDGGAMAGGIMVKVNVKFPSNYSNPRSDFETFWYDGYYYITTIDHVFDNGDFYQVLTMYANPSDINRDTHTIDPCKSNEGEPTVGATEKLEATYTPKGSKESETIKTTTKPDPVIGGDGGGDSGASAASENPNNATDVKKETAPVVKDPPVKEMQIDEQTGQPGDQLAA